ncbi:Proto-oncogene DBL [Chelonia mydas]|uniref:Proto-oncogene DBL n=1 Tax=Chelonia mydas TaxID=8469 RepID=M7BBQ3_CHEMY|nr:Proto-oncogene DBL [Chelonia mydas]
MALARPAPERIRISEVEMERYYCLLQAAARLDSSVAAPGSCRAEPRCRSERKFHGVAGLTGLLLGRESLAARASFTGGTDNLSQKPKNKQFNIDPTASFPGNLQLVMVLRPTGFFQRTFTDIGFRFSQEDFLLKLPVVMLSSVSDLLMYIDEKQLTPEFGGTLEYRHSEWVIFRTAIESFALTVKEIAQMLQSFGTELAETELPDDTYSIERILALRTEKYCQLKGDITVVTKEGNVLLSSLEEPNANERSQKQHHDRPGDWETVNRLLAQLHEMETAFDGFWEKHQLKMEQYLQLWKFEQSFQELQSAIEFLMGQQVELPDTGDSVAQVKQRLKDLGNLDGMAQDLVGKAQVVILHGHQLAANHHYALSLICQQCNELRHHSDVLSEEIKRKRVRLQMTLDLHTRVQQALECCDEGANLLANQPMDKCQSKEGAQKALEDIDKFLESSLLYLNYDPQVLCYDFESVLTPEIKDQIQSVQVKLENIRTMFENRQTCFKKLVDKQVRPVQLVAPRPENPPRSKSPLFSPKHGMDFNSGLKFSFDISLPGKKTSRKSLNSRKIEVMHDYQEKRNSLQSFISESEDNLDTLKGHVINELIETERVYVEELSTVLMGYRAEMENPAMVILMPPALRNREDVLFGNMPEIYDFHNKIFLHNLESCVGAPERVGLCFLERRKDFQMYEKYCQNKPRSESLWRQCSESTFFQELLKYSTSCDGVKELQEALVAMLDLLKSVNDSMHQISITGYDGDLSELGKVLMQGSFSVWTGHRKGPTKMKELARFKPMQRHLFLYEKALVFCKKREEHGDAYDKTSSYSFKHFLKMNAVGITENVKGDHRKFEIWYSGREEVYVVQAPTVDVKMAWLSEMRKILFKQQELIKVEKKPYGLFTDQIQLSPQLSDGKQHRASISSEENDSERTSPVMLDRISSSPQNKPKQNWSRMSQSVEICEGLEDWSSNNYLSNCSDTEEEDGSQLSPGKYKALADCKNRGSEDLLVKNGDVIQLLHEDGEGQCFANIMKQFALVRTLMTSVTGFVIYASRIVYAGSIKPHVDFLPLKQKADFTFLQVDILIRFMQ